MIPLVPTISRVPPNGISLVLEDSSPIVIVEFAKLAFDILAEPDKFEFVNPVIVLLPAAIVLFVTVSVEFSVNTEPSVEK